MDEGSGDGNYVWVHHFLVLPLTCAQLGFLCIITGMQPLQ